MSTLSTSKVKIRAGQETLTGEYLTRNAGDAPQLLFLHGAGQANKERAKPLAQAVVNATGLGAFLLDFSGHGESSGQLDTSSLKKRTEEAEAAWSFLARNKPIAVIAFSMGGHIALELLATHTIDSLILFYPGVYSRQAFDVPFDHRFSAIIRQDKSWRDASVFDNLKTFTGNLLIVYGANDAVVPEEVITMTLDSATKAKRKKLYIVPDVPHLLLPTVYANPSLLAEVVGKISHELSPLSSRRQ